MSTDKSILEKRANKRLRNRIKEEVAKVCRKVDAHRTVEHTAKEMVDCVDANWLTGRRPSTMAATVVYAAHIHESHTITQNRLEFKTGVSARSIGDKYVKFIEAVEAGE